MPSMASSFTSIADISNYFDRIVDLIPPKHYFDSADAINLKYLKRSERDSTKAEFKEQYKKGKKARLDPESTQTTTGIQQERHNGGAEPSTSEAIPPPPPLRANLSSSASAFYCLFYLPDRYPCNGRFFAMVLPPFMPPEGLTAFRLFQIMAMSEFFYIWIHRAWKNHL